MSKEAYLHFLDRAAQDEALQRGLAGVATGSPAAIDAETLARFATERGFAVTAADVRGHILELGDEDLKQVAGGSITGGAGSGRADWNAVKWIDIFSLLGNRKVI